MKKGDWVDQFFDRLEIPPPNIPVNLSIVIPTYNCGDRIEMTLESLKGQKYPSLEVVVVDAGSTDHTLSVVRGYDKLITRIYTIATSSQASMLNRGISLCTGRYITFLYPGTIYLNTSALLNFSSFAERNNFPELLYSGLIKRELFKESSLINSPFNKKAIQLGYFPSSMPACLFRSDVFKSVGKFEKKLKLRLGYDLICRIAKLPKTRVERIERVLLDVDLGPSSYGKAMLYNWETWWILYYRFGLISALRWAWKLDQMALTKALWQQITQRLFKN